MKKSIFELIDDLNAMRQKDAESTDDNLQCAFDYEILSNTIEELAVAEEELRQQTEELQHSRYLIELERQRYLDLFNFAPDGYLVTDGQGQIEDANLAALSLFGIPLDMLKRMNITRLAAYEDRLILNNALARLKQLKDVRDLEVRMQLRREFSFDALINASAVHPQSSEEISLRWLIRDISKRKSQEERLHQSHQDFQDFTYRIAHDLQEPLRKSMAFARLLDLNYKEALGVEGRDYLDRLLTSFDRMQSLIQSLAGYSYVKVTRHSVQKTDLNQIVQDALHVVGLKIKQTEAHVEIGDLPVIEANPIQIRQLFEHLLRNALKFKRPEVPPLIRVYGSLESATCRIVVEDNGIGFDEQHSAMLFKPLYKLDKHPASGPGMGLAICKRIAEQHGGTITAQSTPGEGSKFIIHLPVHHTNP